MIKGLENFRRRHEMGNGYTIRPCDEDGHVLITRRVENAEEYFGCYEATIQAGIRFPLHPAISEILSGYDVGLFQLSPNSYFNILGYIVGYTLQKVTPTFTAFSFMHYMTRAPYGEKWFILNTRKEYMMTLSKNNKWKDWKHRFYYIHATQQAASNFKLNRFNEEPPLLGKVPDTPLLTLKDRKEIIEPGLFEVEELEHEGVMLSVPKFYAPRYEWLMSSVFLSAFGLSDQYTPGI